MKEKLILLLTLVTVASLTVVVPAAGVDSNRIAGDDRFDTSARIAQVSFPSSADVVYLAGGDRFADALAAGTLTDGPILLVPSCGAVPATITDAVERLNPGEVVALGGTVAVCDQVLTDAARGVPTSRIAGSSRYETAAAISRRAFPDTANFVYVANGENSPDAVAGGALTNGPILLIPPTGSVADAQAEIQRLGPQAVIALGGPAAVSDTQLDAVAGDLLRDRLAGSTRFETAVEIADTAFPTNPAIPSENGIGSVYLARSDVFADAVAAGSLTDGPVLLVPACGDLPTAVADYIAAADPDTVTALGGPNAVCDPTLAAAAGDTPPTAPPSETPTDPPTETPTTPPVTPGTPAIPTSGSLFYEWVSTFTRYDFDTRFETSLFYELSASWTMPPDSSEFVWWDNNLNREAVVTIHDADTAEITDQIVLPYELRTVPQIVPNSDFVAALRFQPLANGDTDFSREQLVVFDRDGQTTRGISNVKDFALGSDGTLVISSETGNGTPVIARVNGDYLSEDESITATVIRSFPTYDTLPEGLTLSPLLDEIAYTYLDHIYTLALEPGSDHRQMTVSGTEEREAVFSPDGSMIALNYDDIGNTSGCGTIFIIDNHDRDTPTRLVDGGAAQDPNNPGPFPYVPLDDSGDDIAVCGAGIFWR